MARTKHAVDEVLATVPVIGEPARYKSTGNRGPWHAVVCGVGNGPNGEHTLIVFKPNGTVVPAEALIGEGPNTFVLLSDMPARAVTYLT